MILNTGTTTLPVVSKLHDKRMIKTYFIYSELKLDVIEITDAAAYNFSGLISFSVHVCHECTETA